MRASESISLPTAWISHVLALLFGIFVVGLAGIHVIYFVRGLYAPAPEGGYFGFLRAVGDDIVFSMGTVRFWLVLGVLVVLSEAVHLLLALLAMSWTAGNETVGSAIRHSLRTSWLLTPLPLCWFFGFWLCVVISDAPLVRSVLPLANSRVWLEWGFYWAVIILSAWALWVLLRAAVARPEQPRAATTWCETCGYGLSGTGADSRCPECGEPAAHSLGPGVRHPTDWEDCPTGSAVVAYVRTLREIVLHHTRFFRRTHAYSGQGRARSFLIVSTLVASLLVGLPFLILLAFRDMLDLRNLTFLSLVPAMHFGCILGSILLFSGMVGVAVSWTCRRPLLAPVARVFFYLSGLYVLLVPAWWLLVFLLEIGWLDMLGAPAILNLPRWVRVNLGSFTAIALLPLLLVYLVVVHARGIRQVIHANT